MPAGNKNTSTSILRDYVSSVLHVMSVYMFGAVYFLNAFILSLLCVQFIYFSNGN